MLLTAAGFALGVFVFQQLPSLPHGGWLVLLLPVLWCWWKIPRAAWICAVLAGYFWAQFHSTVTQPQRLPATALQDVVLASGIVQDIPDSNSHRIRFFFQVQRLQQEERRLSGNWRFRISWYQQPPKLVAGDRWTLPLRLKMAHGYHNPGGFDYEGWLYARKVVYTGYVKGEGMRTGQQRWSLDRLRQEVVQDIHQAHLSRRAAGVMAALVVGDRSGLSREDKAVFAATGTSHLIAISGLHIGLIAALVYFLVRWGWQHFPWCCCRWPARVAAAPFAMIAALAYAAMAGFTVPTQRALVMLLVVMLGIVMRRSTSPVHLLGLALVAVVLWDPFAVVSAGFWLSFAAVGAIVFLAAGTAGRFSWLWVQLGIFLALSPVLVWQQLPVSLVSPLVNLVAIPVFALLIVPLTLLAVLLQMMNRAAGHLLLQVVGWLLDHFLWGLDAVASWSPALHWGAVPVPGLVIIAVVALLATWRVRKTACHPLWRLSFVSVACLCLILYVQHVAAPFPNRFRLTLLDVGQGLSVVVRTARHVLVFDTGPRYPSGFNTGSSVLLPYLKSQGIHGIDKLVLSHSDIDHVGGAPDLIRSIPIADIVMGEPPGLGMPVPGQPCVAGETWWWEGVRFEVLYPPDIAGLEGNNASCVLRISAGGQEALLTGDIEKQGEEWLLNFAGDRLKSALVVAAHHGSASSSSTDFVAAAQAHYVLFSAGKNNRWGFPRKKVLDRWHASGAKSLNTANAGAIEFTLGAGVDAEASTWFSRSRHYWHK